jgi:hypothetical protein
MIGLIRKYSRVLFFSLFFGVFSSCTEDLGVCENAKIQVTNNSNKDVWFSWNGDLCEDCLSPGESTIFVYGQANLGKSSKVFKYRYDDDGNYTHSRTIQIDDCMNYFSL